MVVVAVAVAVAVAVVVVVVVAVEEEGRSRHLRRTGKDRALPALPFLTCGRLCTMVFMSQSLQLLVSILRGDKILHPQH